MLKPCRHISLCEKCSNKKEIQKCPVCRATITKRVKVHHS